MRSAPQGSARVEGHAAGQGGEERIEPSLGPERLHEAAIAELGLDLRSDAAAHDESAEGQPLEGEIARLGTVDRDEEIEGVYTHGIAAGHPHPPHHPAGILDV